MNPRLKLLDRLIRLEAMRKAADASVVFDQVRQDMQSTLGLIHGANQVASKAEQHSTDLIRSAFQLNALVDRAENASGAAVEAEQSANERAAKAKEAERIAQESRKKAEAIVADLGKSLANVGESERKVVSMAEAVERKLAKERGLAGEAKKVAEQATKALSELLPVVKAIEYDEETRWLVAVLTDGSTRQIVKMPKPGVFGGLGLLPQGTAGGTGSGFTIASTTSSGYTLSATAPTLLMVDATGASLTVNLPVAANATAEHIVQRIDAGYASNGHLVTITGDNINGDGDAVIQQRNTAIHLYPTPANGWRIA